MYLAWGPIFYSRRVGIAEDRRFQVLRAIVTDFVATQEPVGSKSLVERYNMGVSSATIRNDMAILEEEGYITQPHTSSGRIPTEKGYREFVNRLDEIKPLSGPERRAILSFLESGVDLDDVLRRAVGTLARLTQQVAVVQYPTLSLSTIRRVEIITIHTHRLLVVVITDSGRVDQRLVELDDTLDDEDLLRLQEIIGATLHGKKISVVSPELAAMIDNHAPHTSPFDQGLCRIAATILDCLIHHDHQPFLLRGTANLTRHVADFGNSLRPILEALEEQVVLLRLLAAQHEAGKITVRIGHETELEDISAASVVSTTYGSPSSLYGTMAVLGPTRMDYPSTMASVAAVATYIGEVLGTR